MDDEVVVLTSDEMKKRVAIWKDQVPNKTMMITQRMEGYKRDIYLSLIHISEPTRPY